MYADQIIQSFELAAERTPDLTPLVYARLFREHPEMERLFVRDKDGSVKGEMLARVIEAILDFVGDKQYATTLIQCEVVTHAGYDVPPETFRLFFGAVADTLRDLLGAEWTPAMASAWQTTLGDLDYYVTHPDQSETAR